MWQDGGGGGGGCDTTSLTCAADDASGNQWLMDMVMLSYKKGGINATGRLSSFIDRKDLVSKNVEE